MPTAVKTPALRTISGFCTEHVTPLEAVLVRRLAELRIYRPMTALFFLASRLGDGPVWYALGLACLAGGGVHTRWSVLAGGVAAGLSILLFVFLKHRIGRPRPFEVWADVPCLLPPPDRFSFPSGHTMTAFAVYGSFRVLVPEVAEFVLPVAVLVGASRVFLGLHYPSDVLAGGLLGGAIGTGIARLAAGWIP